MISVACSYKRWIIEQKWVIEMGLLSFLPTGLEATLKLDETKFGEDRMVEF